MKKIAAVVVTYNRKVLLRENITHLLKQTKAEMLDVLVIDNASTDGTKAYIDDLLSDRVVYINTGANLGGAGGFQYGIRYAAEHDYDYIWVMDDDCMPTETALEQFLLYDEKLNGNYGFLSSKVLWKDGSICNMNIQKESISRKVSDFDTEIVSIISSTFVSMFFSVNIVKKVGLPIKEFFIWCDDLEYSRRISLQYPCYLINSSVVMHKTENNVGSNIALDDYARLNRYNYAYRNEVYFFRREAIKGKVYWLIRLISHMLRVLLKAQDHKGERLRIIWKATRQGLRFRPEIEYVENRR